MRKICLYITILSLLLCGCAAPSPEDTVREIGEEFAAADIIRMNVNLTADYGEDAYIFALHCELSPEGGFIEIRKPETIAGVRAEIKGDGITLSYDGAEIYTGAILPNGLSPVDAIPVMTAAWRTALADSAVREPYGGYDCVAAEYRISDEVALRTWFDVQSRLPAAAEFSGNGYTVISCTFDNITLG